MKRSKERETDTVEQPYAFIFIPLIIIQYLQRVIIWEPGYHLNSVKCHSVRPNMTPRSGLSSVVSYIIITHEGVVFIVLPTKPCRQKGKRWISYSSKNNVITK